MDKETRILEKQKKDSKLIMHLFNIVGETVNEIGVQQTINVLKIGKNGDVWRVNLDLAAKAVCDSYCIQHIELFGNTRKYPKKYAFASWVYISHKDLKYTLDEIKTYCGKGKSSLWKNVAFMEKCAEMTKSKLDRLIAEKFSESRVKIKELISNK